MVSRSRAERRTAREWSVRAPSPSSGWRSVSQPWEPARREKRDSPASARLALPTKRQFQVEISEDRGNELLDTSFCRPSKEQYFARARKRNTSKRNTRHFQRRARYWWRWDRASSGRKKAWACTMMQDGRRMLSVPGDNRDPLLVCSGGNQDSFINSVSRVQ